VNEEPAALQPPKEARRRDRRQFCHPAETATLIRRIGGRPGAS
jgi:hypothetical protein